jgi:ABC-type branched-subunit amino acid transport system substrate-binding protein
MRKIRWVALLATVVLATAAASTVASAQGSDEEPTATEVGVTDKEIRIAVVADVDNQFSPGVFQGSVDGVKGWAKYVNANGGLAGRKVVVDFIDSKLTPGDSRNAAIKACEEDFAMVGTSAVFLNNVDDIEACVDQAGAGTGIPNLTVVATEIAQQCSSTTYAVNPPQIICSTRDQHPQTYQANVGRAFYYEKKFGKDLHGGYIYSGDLKSAENSNRASMTQMQTAGSGIEEDFEALQSASAPQSAYAPIVQQLKQNSSNYAQSGGVFGTTVLLRKEAKLEGLNEPDFVWDCTLQCYDQGLIEQGGADVEGQFVSTLFLPFEEASSNETLANFLKYTGKKKADGFGIQAYASGLLLGQAVDQIVQADGVNGVTRKALFEQLETINDFDADGMIGTTDIAARETTPCYVLTQVKNGKFVRVTPTKKGTFDCKPRNRLEIELDLIEG